MAKQTAAAQKRAEAEARKAAKLAASCTAAGSQVDPVSSQATLAGFQASKGTAKEVEEASGVTLPNTEASSAPAVAAAVAAAGQSADDSKAELQVTADSSQKDGVATAEAGSGRPLGSNGNVTKPTVAGASTGQNESQASNGLMPGDRGQLVTSSHRSEGHVDPGKSRAGKKRAAEVQDIEDGTRAGQSRSTRSKTGMSPAMSDVTFNLFPAKGHAVPDRQQWVQQPWYDPCATLLWPCRTSIGGLSPCEVGSEMSESHKYQ